jgi:hypothetical protein
MKIPSFYHLLAISAGAAAADGPHELRQLSDSSGYALGALLARGYGELYYLGIQTDVSAVSASYWPPGPGGRPAQRSLDLRRVVLDPVGSP